MSNLMRDLWLKKNAPDAFEEEQKTRRKRARQQSSVQQKAASNATLFPDLYRNDYDEVWLEKAVERHHRSRRMFPDLF